MNIKNCPGDRVGTEILKNDTEEDLTKSMALKDDAFISVSLGEDFIYPDGVRAVKQTTQTEPSSLSPTAESNLNDVDLSLIPQPPRYPWPRGELPCTEVQPIVGEVQQPTEVFQESSESGNEAVCAEISFSNLLKSRCNHSFEFCGIYPVLEGNIYPLIKEAIAECPFFTIKDRKDFISVDYCCDTLDADTFPDPADSSISIRERWLRALRRECRGLILCAHSGIVLARRFAKFFNINEVKTPIILF